MQMPITYRSPKTTGVHRECISGAIFSSFSDATAGVQAPFGYVCGDADIANPGEAQDVRW
jgi:hypothetical protein